MDLITPPITCSLHGKVVTSFDGTSGATKKKVTLSIPVTAQDGKLQIVKAGAPAPSPKPNDNDGSSSTTTTTTTTTTSSSASSSATKPESSSSNSNSQIHNNTNKLNVPKSAAKVGSVVYATKKIALYKDATFKKSQRVATYKNAKRTNRPTFVVKGYARSNDGVLRYQVKDINKGSKTAGRTGYVTANSKYVSPVYYKSVPKSKTITVISKNGVNAYRSLDAHEKVKHYKNGTHLKVKKVVSDHHASRYQLTNGHYITANKKVVIQGAY